MYLCYVDESGVSQVPGNTSHYVLAGLSIPIWQWKTCDNDINLIKRRYDIETSEIHTAWILRSYHEQNQIKDFANLSRTERRYQVEMLRKAELIRLQGSGNGKLYQQIKKNYVKTEAYIHLTRDERRKLIRDIAQSISGWRFARLFAECIDKIHFDVRRAPKPLDEQAFEQVVGRFQRYLINLNLKPSQEQSLFGMLIHDNNKTVARRLTALMKSFHKTGTLWGQVTEIIETPLFVDSELTSMVQMSDLCAYALRRYLENGERDIFDLIFKRADRSGTATVGVRHFTNSTCACQICSSHKMSAT